MTFPIRSQRKIAQQVVNFYNRIVSLTQIHRATVTTSYIKKPKLDLHRRNLINLFCGNLLMIQNEGPQTVLRKTTFTYDITRVPNHKL